ncbi:MAG TPA: hypothetical protein PLR25_02650 [Planctomycetaceae bacterium]|nr:hypothetical protein [Planctomycetaceae bacterium]
MSAETGTCVECGASMVPIRIVQQDRGCHSPLKYAAIDSTRSLVRGRYPLQGEISAELCTGCGRVILRAIPF